MSSVKRYGIGLNIVCLCFFLLMMSKGNVQAETGDNDSEVLLKEKYPGMEFEKYAMIDLGTNFKQMEGYSFRFLKATFQPGAGIKSLYYSEPQVIYVLEGVLTTEKLGESPVDHGPGSVWVTQKGMTYAKYNRADKPLVYIYASIRLGMDGV